MLIVAVKSSKISLLEFYVYGFIYPVYIELFFERGEIVTGLKDYDFQQFTRVEKKTMAALSTTHTFPSLRNASVYCTPGKSDDTIIK